MAVGLWDGLNLHLHVHGTELSLRGTVQYPRTAASLQCAGHYVPAVTSAIYNYNKVLLLSKPLAPQALLKPLHALLLSWGMWVMTGSFGSLQATRHGDWEWADKPCRSVWQLCRFQLCKWPDQQGAAKHHQHGEP